MKNKKIINKINELMLRSYPVSKDDTTDEHWALGKQNLEEIICVL
ncbi:hypothetical protein [Spiroplasma citri]|nr:hypothetical protein [Spiroplasma citri]